MSNNNMPILNDVVMFLFFSTILTNVDLVLMDSLVCTSMKRFDKTAH